jgi:hypothetical protein
MVIYEHLGTLDSIASCNQIDLSQARTSFNKPLGGFWGSRINQEDEYYSWRQWCEMEQFNTEYYLNPKNRHLFSLSNDSKIFLIDGNSISRKRFPDQLSGKFTRDEFNKLITDYKVLRYTLYDETGHKNLAFGLDWDYIVKNYDGFELINGNCWGMFRYNGFYTWDCDSIVVWNTDIINLEEEA